MTTQREHIRQLYEFASWRQAGAQDEYQFIWRFRLSGNELSGWIPHRIQAVQFEDAPPAVLSVWRPDTGGPGSLISVDVFETESRDAARAYLLVLLGEFQGPPLERQNGPGAVAFAAGSSAILFARENLVVFARSVERIPVPVGEVAAQLDRHLTARPDAVEKGGPAILTLRPVGPLPREPGRTVQLVLEAEPSMIHPVWFKVLSRTGDFRLEQQRLAYVPLGPGPHELTVFAISDIGVATRRTVRLE